jgi:hypothetical protein
MFAAARAVVWPLQRGFAGRAGFPIPLNMMLSWHEELTFHFVSNGMSRCLETITRCRHVSKIGAIPSPLFVSIHPPHIADFCQTKRPLPRRMIDWLEVDALRPPQIGNGVG